MYYGGIMVDKWTEEKKVSLQLMSQLSWVWWVCMKCVIKNHYCFMNKGTVDDDNHIFRHKIFNEILNSTSKWMAQ